MRRNYRVTIRQLVWALALNTMGWGCFYLSMQGMALVGLVSNFSFMMLSVIAIPKSERRRQLDWKDYVQMMGVLIAVGLLIYLVHGKPMRPLEKWLKQWWVVLMIWLTFTGGIFWSWWRNRDFPVDDGLGGEKRAV